VAVQQVPQGVQIERVDPGIGEDPFERLGL
jgi:hypothetical protein